MLEFGVVIVLIAVFGVVIGLITYLSIVVGELLPKKPRAAKR